MNSWISLLLLSSVAGKSIAHISHTSLNKHPKHTPNATLKRNEASTVNETPDETSLEASSEATNEVPNEAFTNPTSTTSNTSEPITMNALRRALYAADEAVGMTPTATGPFSLPPLDYSYDALEPYIDEETLRIHHKRHHGTYVERLNAALERYPEFYSFTLNELLLFPDRLPSDIQTQVTNNGGGHYNHSLMWKVIGPQKASAPTGVFAEAVRMQFGSFEKLKSALKTAALSVFGSGYAYLILNPSGRLLIVTTQNQTTPIPLRSIPLLPIDMWEHAYYLKHQNQRKLYVDDYFNVINWEQVGKRYEAALKALRLPE